MSENNDANVDLLDEEFERLGRKAGDELRLQPPADGPGAIALTAHRRRMMVVAAAAGVTVAIVATGLFVANSRIEEESPPIATVPEIEAPVPTVTPSNPEATPLDAVRTTTPGTWRAVSDPSALAPEFPSAAVWTGTEAIVIGSNSTSNSALSVPLAAAYLVGQDRWRSLADPPPALGLETLEAVSPTMQWTGSEVLAATSQGAVFGYDPVRDRWESRAAADESMSLPEEGALVAVSARGVLARSSTGWWWYEYTTDRWESVPAPSDDSEYSTLAVLDPDRIVASWIDGATITSAVFEIATRRWSTGRPVDAPVSSNGRQRMCDANDGLLVCFAETFGGLDGVVIDPLTGVLDTFELGNHSNTINIKGLPWMTHAWKLLSPRTATWEDLPPSPYDDVDSFAAAVWTGSEIVWFGGMSSATMGGRVGATAAYTPLQLPGPRRGTPDVTPLVDGTMSQRNGDQS